MPTYLTKIEATYYYYRRPVPPPLQRLFLIITYDELLERAQFITKSH